MITIAIVLLGWAALVWHFCGRPPDTLDEEIEPHYQAWLRGEH